MDSGLELFSMLGSPARIIGRLPLAFRLLCQGSSAFKTSAAAYATERFGTSYRMRPWLLLDLEELEAMEHLINQGSDEEVFAFRRMHLASGATTTVVVSVTRPLMLESLTKKRL